MKGQIIVLGRGVSGLTTALLLLEQFVHDEEERPEVIVMGEKCLDDWIKDTAEGVKNPFCSPVAGASWQSFPSTPLKQQQLERITIEEMGRRFKKKEDQEEAGIGFYESSTLFTTELEGLPWFSEVVNNFKVINNAKLGNSTFFKSGYSHEAPLINPLVYLRYMENKITNLGGKIQILGFHFTSLSHFFQLNSECKLLFNCTGLGSKEFVNDSTMFALEGQVLVVERKVSYALSLESQEEEERGEGTYIIPRCNGTVILGGIFKDGTKEMPSEEEITRGILERVTNMLKAWGDDDFANELPNLPYKVCTGSRPARRDGTPKIDLEEWMDDEGGRRCVIIHNYGHAGYGYQTSYGASLAALNLYKSGCESKKGFICDHTANNAF